MRIIIRGFSLFSKPCHKIYSGFDDILLIARYYYKSKEGATVSQYVFRVLCFVQVLATTSKNIPPMTKKLVIICTSNL